MGFFVPFKDTLKLTFKDELDMEQTCVFNMKKLEDSQKAIYDRTVEAKKKRLAK